MAKENKKNKKNEVVPDWSGQYGKHNEIDIALYEKTKKKKTTYNVKITFSNAFVLYAKIKETSDGDYFIAMPSWKNKEGEYINHAYCFDKDLMSAIIDDITEFIDED